jgi:hypothetical protein
VDRVPSGSEAAALAGDLLSSMPDRWLHTQAVAARTDELANAVPEADWELLRVAAWWHDLGYAPPLAETGFHPLDGARFLDREGYSPRLCALIAHHSGASFEAEERGLGSELSRWPREEGAVADALWMADMTTGPRGERLDYEDRLAEILSRYEPGSPVARAMTRARPAIEAAITRARERLAAG